MADYIASIDQGTTSTRCILFNHSGEIVSSHQLEHEQIYPKPGWVEHDAEEIWDRTKEVIKIALFKANANAHDIAAVGITNQRETTLVWDRQTGKPYYNAIVWQDTRTANIISELGKVVGQNRFQERVGLPLATYFSGPKIRWILDNVEGVREAALKGRAIFGNMDTWLIWNLTGGVNGGLHITDVTNASRTMLMDLKHLSGMRIFAKLWMFLSRCFLKSDRHLKSMDTQKLMGHLRASFLSPVILAINRLRLWDKPVSLPEKPKTPMERVVS